jgi:hypothetical protein
MTVARVLCEMLISRAAAGSIWQRMASDKLTTCMMQMAACAGSLQPAQKQNSYAALYTGQLLGPVLSHWSVAQEGPQKLFECQYGP